jgi:hypothetical protein
MPKHPPVQRRSADLFNKNPSTNDGVTAFETNVPTRVATDAELYELEKHLKEINVLPSENTGPVPYSPYRPLEPTPKSKPNTSAKRWYEKHKSELKTFRLPKEIHDYIKKVGDELNVIHGEVLHAFLLFALEDYKKGVIDLPAGEYKRLTLFPKNGWGRATLSTMRGGIAAPSQKQTKVKAKKVREITSSSRYLGIPDSLVDELKEIANKSGFPYWDITAFFLSYAIGEYEKNVFTLLPQAK